MFQFMLAARPWARIFFCGGVAPFGCGLDTPAASGNGHGITDKHDRGHQQRRNQTADDSRQHAGKQLHRQGLAKPQTLNTKAASVAANI